MLIDITKEGTNALKDLAERWKSLDARVCSGHPYNEFRIVSDRITGYLGHFVNQHPTSQQTPNIHGIFGMWEVECRMFAVMWNVGLQNANSVNVLSNTLVFKLRFALYINFKT